MRDRDIEVLVMQVGSNKSAFSEKTVNDVTYALIPSAGCEYIVRIILHRNKYTQFFPFEDVPCQCLKVGLYIDGIDCGYYKRVSYSKALPHHHSTVACEFTGFRTEGNRVRAFVVSNTIGSSDMNINESSTSNNVGNIKVTFNMAKATENVFENRSTSREVPGASKLVDNNQKYFKQAKYSTGAGRTLNMSFTTTKQWVNINSLPDKTITMKYQKTDIIEALAAALITSSSSPSESATGVVKRVREEGSNNNSPSKSKRAIMVDLTGEEEEVQEVEAPPVEVSMLDLETGVETFIQK